MSNKITSADEAVSIVHSGDTLTTSVFVGVGTPDELPLALEERFLEAGEARGPGLIYGADQSDGKGRGVNALCPPRRLRRPDEIAALAAHFVGNLHLNGETTRLDGALRMAPR